jgi:prepilin signal peptidase PulO-like enzyme (type II secretory pathway)
MMLMIIAGLILLGLPLGSFVNALVWRLHEQTKTGNKHRSELSIAKGRSMCPHCEHQLTAKDLVPVLSWLSLRGKCRYCNKPISTQYPLVELATAALFVVSYVWWPQGFSSAQTVAFGLWLVLLTGLMALSVYDLRWKLLPNRLMRPLGVVAALFALTEVATAHKPALAALNAILGVAVGGGIFYVLFQVSKGKWIGGGDVKLGWLLGLIVATPGRAVLMIFLASLLGTIISLPLLASKRLKRSSTIPFGPFLILAAIIVQLFGHALLHWYQKTFFPFTL